MVSVPAKGNIFETSSSTERGEPNKFPSPRRGIFLKPYPYGTLAKSGFKGVILAGGLCYLSVSLP